MTDLPLGADFLDELPVGVFRLDTEGNCYFVNRRWQELTGLSAVQAQGQGWVQALHAEDRDKFWRDWEDSIKAGRTSKLEYRLQRPDGEVIWVIGKLRGQRNAQGETIGAISTVTDFTANKKISSQLQESNALLERVFNTSHTMIAYMDADFNFLRVNESYAAVDGKSPDFFVGKNHFDLYPNEENQALFAKVVRSGEPHFAYAKDFEYEHNPERGTTYWDWSLWPVRDDNDEVNGVVLVLVDVTQRVRAQGELRHERNFMEAILQTANALVVVLDKEGRIARFNKAAEELTYYSSAEVLGRKVWDFLLPAEQIEPVKQVFENLKLEGLAGEYINAWVAKDRSRRLIQWNNAVIKGADNQVEYIVSIGVDVTEKRAVAEQIRENEARFKQLTDNIDEVFWMISVDGSEVIYISPAYEQIWGRSRENLYADSRQWLQAVHEDDVAAVRQALKDKIMANRYDEEYRIIRPDGEVRWINDRAFVVRDEQGEPYRIAGVASDITERKRVQQALQQQEWLLAQSERIGKTGSFIWDVATDSIPMISDQFVDIYGITPQKMRSQVLQKMLTEVVHPDDADRVQAAMSRALAGDGPFRVEHRIVHADGSIKHVAVHGELTRKEDGTPISMIGIGQDITERKLAEQQLTITQAAVDTSVDGIAIADLEGKLTYVNGAFLTIWGYESPSQVLGRSAFNFWEKPEEAQHVVDIIAKEGRWVGELNGITRQGNTILVRLAASMTVDEYGEPLCMMASFVDVTKERKVEEELTRKEETLAEAQAIAKFGSWDWNIESDELTWSDETYRIFGLRPQQFGGTYEAFLAAIPPDHRQLVMEGVDASIKDPDKLYNVEHRVMRPDGEIRLVSEHGLVYRDQDGKPVRMIGTVHDITERRQAQEELSRFKTTLDMTLDCVFMFDPDDLRFFYVNQGAMDQVGYNRRELMQMTPYDIKPDYDEAQFRALIAPMINGDVPVMYFETVHESKKGSRIPVEIFLQFIKPEGESPRFVAIVRDISERRKVEAELARHRDQLEDLVNERTEELRRAHDQLVKKERLATLGQLTATVSHELRNPLGAIKSSLYLMSRKLENNQDSRLLDALSRVDRNVSRCDHIIDELLDFTRAAKLDQREQNLNAWLQGTLEEMSLPESIEIQLQLDTQLDKVSFDGARLRRAIINVVENACHAMRKEGGVGEYMDDARLSVATRRLGDRVEIEMRDCGSGIPPDVLKRMFEPLYSTKGFGVGLGMPTVKQIMEQHGGTVQVSSQPGRGSVVSLFLPAQANEPAL